MPTTESTDTTGRWTAETWTGKADFTFIRTQWDEAADAYITRVSEYVGARWLPLEYHRNTIQDRAAKTHRSAVRRHPRNGNARTLPRSYADGYCSRCGHAPDAAHADDCRE